MEAVRELPQSKILQEWWQEVKENFWQCQAKIEMSYTYQSRNVLFLSY